MANQFTTKEVLNKVLLDSSGDAITANSVTSQEALNAVLDTSNNRLNVSLGGSNTISGDVTITGDLTVQGSATNTFDEQIQGIVQILGSTGTGATPAGTLQLTTSETTIVDNDQLGRIEFLAASEADGSDSQLVGASIAGEAEATFAADNNSTALVFSTNTSAAATERMRIDSSGNIGIGENSPNQLLHLKATSGSQVLLQRTSADTGSVLGAINFGASDGDEYLATIISQHDGQTDSAYLAFQTEATGGSKAERMRITSGGLVGIGISTMESAGGGVSRLQVEGTTHETSSVSITRNSNSANAGYLTFSKSRGTSVNSDTIVQDDDAIGSILFAPADGTDRNSISASIQGAIDGTPGSNDVPGRLVFSTTADGANSVTERMRIDSVGNIGIGIANPALSYGTGLNLSDTNVGIRLSVEGSGGWGFIEYQDESGTVQFIQGYRDTDETYRINASNSLSNTDGIAISNAGLVGIGTASPVAKMDIVGTRTLNLTDTLADDTNKNAVITSSQWDSGGQPKGFLMMQSFSNNSTNRVDIGGGNSAHNSAEEIRFFTGNDTNVLTGTQAMHIDNAQNIGIGTTVTSGNKLTIAGDNILIKDNNLYLKGMESDASTEAYLIGINGSDEVVVGNGTGQLLLDANSRISLSNNDAGGTGGQNSTSSNTTLGYKAGNAIASGTINNTFIGHNAGLSANDAVANVVVGTNSADALTTGDHNVVLGYFALSASTDVDSVVAIGSGAMESGNVTSGADGSIAVGRNSLLALTSGAGNTSVGFESLKTENDGSRNTAIGYKALTTLNTSAGNGETTAVGFEAGADVSTGIANTFVGSRAGNQGTNDITTGSNNTMIGKEARGSADSASNQTVIGASAIGQADNSVTLGNSSVTDVYMSEDKGAKVHCLGIDIQESSLSTADSYRGFYHIVTKTGGDSNTGDDYQGIYNQMNWNHSDTYGVLGGIYNSSTMTTGATGSSFFVGLQNQTIQTNGNCNNLHGIWNNVNIDDGTIDEHVNGIYNVIDKDGGAIAGNLSGILTDINLTATGSIDYVFGLQTYIDCDESPQRIYGNYLNMQGAGTGAAGTDYFQMFYDGENSDIVHQITYPAGVATFDSGDFSGAPDYAEYFESKDGKAIAIGSTVKLDGDKIVVCSDGDTPMGVVRPKSAPSVVSNAKTTIYHAKYLTTDYDEIILEDYKKKKWE